MAGMIQSGQAMRNSALSSLQAYANQDSAIKQQNERMGYAEDKQSQQMGAAIGATLGGVAGAAYGGPVGAALGSGVGTALGSFAGSLF